MAPPVQRLGKHENNKHLPYLVACEWCLPLLVLSHTNHAF
jgi:hypothetical protein